jgi:hypothetical protein
VEQADGRIGCLKLFSPDNPTGLLVAAIAANNGCTGHLHIYFQAFMILLLPGTTDI